MLESRQGNVFRSKQRARQGNRVILCSLKAGPLDEKMDLLG